MLRFQENSKKGRREELQEFRSYRSCRMECKGRNRGGEELQ
jgi:hypothetical protein